jgi:predicted  nucleic acid-binding Zn-ribbon protein
MSQISVLYRLQQVDSQLDVANTKLRNIEKVLLDDVSVSDARKIAIQTDEHHKSLLKILRESEAKSYDTRVKIELAEASLYGGKIQNPKELQELQNEIASLKRFLINLEDKQLEAMMQVEESE